MSLDVAEAFGVCAELAPEVPSSLAARSTESRVPAEASGVGSGGGLLPEPPLPVRDRGSSFFSSAARHRCSGSILEAQPVPISPGP